MKNRKKPIIITLCSLVLCLSLVLGIMLHFPVQANAVELVTAVSNMSSGSGVSQSADNQYVFNDGAKVHVVGWYGDRDQYNKPWEIPLDAWWNDSVYTYDATAEKWRADNNMRWQNGEDQHNFVAWWPENIVKSTGDLENVNITLTGDPKSDDILLARSYDQKRPDNNKLNLQFEHLMARLDVNLIFKDYYTDVKEISVTANLRTEATCNFFTGKVESSGTTKTVNLTESHTISGYNWSGSCITVPQEINLHDVGLTINFTAGGEKKQVKLQEARDMIFASGQRITYNLTIGNDAVELDKVTATDWADSSDNASEPGKQQMTDEFTLVLSKQGNRQNKETHQMSFSDSGWNTVLSKALPAEAFAYKGEGVTVYEYSQGWSYNVTLQKDQSTPEKLAAADVMIATGSVEADVPLDLNFEHYFAKMTFIVSFGTEYADKDPELTDIKFMDDISCFLNTETESMKIIEVICNPTWIVAGGQIFTLKVDGVPNDIKLVEGAALQAGVNYLNLLKIGRDKVELTQVSEIGSPGGWSAEVNLDGTTGTVGTADEGKTAWENGDKILVHLHSNKYGDQSAVMTFDGTEWKPDDATLKYFEDEEPTITAVYAPDCEIKSDRSIGLIDGKQYGLSEYIPANTTVYEDTLGIRFESGRPYSRLRIVAEPFEQLTVTTTTGFTPAGTSDSTPKEYTLTADANGNAYLYGTFAANGTVKVVGDVTVEHTFTEATAAGTSYALDARARYVDLGLSVNWATVNIGATKPEEVGNFFAWGETEPKETFSQDNYKLSDKYNATDGKTVLDDSDDAAKRIWGNGWRMPTADEFAELLDESKCTWIWTTVNGKDGYLITSKVEGYEGNSIFLPFELYKKDSGGTVQHSGYWSKSLSGENTGNCLLLPEDSDNKTVGSTERACGLLIRPVRDK